MVINKGADFKGIGNKFHIDPVTARIIRNREVIGDEEIHSFLAGTLQELPDVHLMQDLDLLVELLDQKINEKAKIRIIGDYDIDGVMSSYILYRALTRCGAQVDVAIPNRITDGYGLNRNLITEALECGVDTILTCDNGIAAIEEISYAKEAGMTVLVTDHHEIPFKDVDEERIYMRSEADAIVNPHQKTCTFPYKDLCGAGVAWAVIVALYEKNNIKVDIKLIRQYIQHDRTARSFAAYYDLFNKYRSDYQIDEILSGNASDSIKDRAENAKFDERLSLLGLILDSVTASAKQVTDGEDMLRETLVTLKEFKRRTHDSDISAEKLMNELIAVKKNELENGKRSSSISVSRQKTLARAISQLENMTALTVGKDGKTAFADIRSIYDSLVSELKISAKTARDKMSNAFIFCNEVYTDGQEMLILVTELTANSYTARFISEFGCKEYYEHNKALLFVDRSKEIMQRLEEFGEI